MPTESGRHQKRPKSRKKEKQKKAMSIAIDESPPRKKHRSSSSGVPAASAPVAGPAGPRGGVPTESVLALPVDTAAGPRASKPLFKVGSMYTGEAIEKKKGRVVCAHCFKVMKPQEARLYRGTSFSGAL